MLCVFDENYFNNPGNKCIINSYESAPLVHFQATKANHYIIVMYKTHTKCKTHVKI